MTTQTADRFTAVYRTWAPRIFNHYRRLSWDPEDASDLTAEVFRVAWTRQAELREQSRIGAWLWTIAGRLAANRVRTDDRRRRREAEAAPEIATSGAEAPAKQRLKRAFQSLPDRDRQLLLWREYSGLSYAEIAELTGQTVEGVRAALYRARVLLRDEFQKRWE